MSEISNSIHSWSWIEAIKTICTWNEATKSNVQRPIDDDNDDNGLSVCNLAAAPCRTQSRAGQRRTVDTQAGRDAGTSKLNWADPLDDACACLT